MKRKNLDQIEGATPEEKLAHLGVNIGDQVDIRDLNILHDRYGVQVVLYFEEDLVRKGQYEQDLAEHAHVPVYERPFIEVGTFLGFAGESDPTFAQRLIDFPLLIQVIGIGQLSDREKTPYLTGLMPFVDEIEW
jgi:hypothetical protein